jgi:hypothetical protein
MGNAEFSSDRYATDIGPPCKACKMTTSTGLYVYLVSIVAREGTLPVYEVTAQCACCHTLTHLPNLRGRMSRKLTATDIRQFHERCMP